MANLNKVMLIGRLTRDPEVRTFSNGGRVAKLGFAVNNRKRTTDGTWVDDPVFIDLDVFDRGENKMALRASEHLRKGMQVYVEGHLRLDSWQAQDGTKRSKHTIVVDQFQYLEPRPEQAPRAPRQEQGPEQEPAITAPPQEGGDLDNIPF